MRYTSNLKSLAGCLVAMAGLAACTGASGDYPGTEFSPQMYHSVAYEPLTQITDESQGKWISTKADERGEFFNSNPYNSHNMNMRQPVENTVKRSSDNMLPYRYPKDSAGSTYYLDLASQNLRNPVPETEAVLEQGRLMYNNFCAPCHGGSGKGDGPVGEVYRGVPDYSVGRYREMTEGHVFHVITHGQGRMWPHGSQVAPEDRWKIVHYVQTLQNQ